MKGIAEFHDKVLTAFANSNLKMIKRIGSKIKGDTLYLTIASAKQGTRNCINSKCLSVHPEANKPHHMCIEEVWLGYDGDGCPWSDHMGGQLIDCTGLTIAGAINEIVGQINKHI